MDQKLPEVGSRAVEKATAEGKGPVWQVTGHTESSTANPVPTAILEHASHRLNRGLDEEVRQVTPYQFHEKYKLI